MRDRIGEDGELFIADGEKTVLRLLESNLNIIKVFALEKYIHKHLALIQQKVSRDMVFCSSKAHMQTILGYQVHQGFMALAHKPDHIELDGLANKVLVLNHVVSSENTGAIVRSSVAFGINSILIDQKSCHPYIRRAVRVSTGSVFTCDISRTDDLHNSLQKLKDDGYRIIGSSSNHTKNTILASSFEFPRKFALIFGNEGLGIDAKIVALCDHVLNIPTGPGVSSLNVANAATILLYLSSIGSL